MDRLRHRERMVFSGFTHTEVEKLECLYGKYGALSVNRDFCLKLAKGINRSAGRAGKPVVKWAEVQSWFQNRLQICPNTTSPSKNENGINHSNASLPSQKEVKEINHSNASLPSQKEEKEIKHSNASLPSQKEGKDINHSNASLPSQKEGKDINHSNASLPSQKEAKEIILSPNACNFAACPNDADPKKTSQSKECHKEGEKVRDLSELEFEARSSRDGAWYDVERFLNHRYASSAEVEVRVRFVGFGSEEDEWVNVKNDVRERSIPLENWDCQKVKIGEVMLCLQERKDQAIYYDVEILEIKRKMHDIRGCRCIFSVQYIHDKSEESVRLRRLCRILRHDSQS